MMSLGQKCPPIEVSDCNQPDKHSLRVESKAIISLVMLIVAFSLLRLPWPGDASFVFDEPQLLEMALQASVTGKSLPFGLKGLRGVHYGPLPIWIYRTMLSVTHNLVAIVVVRVVLVTTITSCAIIWLARLCRHLWPIGGALALLSPYLWFYSRGLWDNSFCIPLTAMAFAAYLAFCNKRQWWTLLITSLCLTFLFLTHLMSIPVIAAISFHFLIFHRGWWRKHWWAPLLCGTTGLLIAWPYITYLLKASVAPPPFSNGTYDSASAQAWVFGLLGGRFFTAYGLDYSMGYDWVQALELPDLIKFMVAALGRISGIALLAGWLGTIYCTVVVIAKFRQKQEHDIKFHGCLISLTVLFFQTLLNVMGRTYKHPHYYNATWIYSFFFFWSAISLITSQKWRRFAFVVYSSAMITVLISVMVSLHLTGGNRKPYGPTLTNQIEVAKKLNEYSPHSLVENQVSFAREFKYYETTYSIDTEFRNNEDLPHTLRFLKRLYAETADTARPVRKLLIRYTSQNRNSSRIKVIELK